MKLFQTVTELRRVHDCLRVHGQISPSVFFQNGGINSCVSSRVSSPEKYALRSRSSRTQNVYGSVTALVESVILKDYVPAEDQKTKIQ